MQTDSNTCNTGSGGEQAVEGDQQAAVLSGLQVFACVNDGLLTGVRVGFGNGF